MVEVTVVVEVEETSELREEEELLRVMDPRCGVNMRETSSLLMSM